MRVRRQVSGGNEGGEWEVNSPFQDSTAEWSGGHGAGQEGMEGGSSKGPPQGDNRDEGDMDLDDDMTSKRKRPSVDDDENVRQCEIGMKRT